MHYRFWVNAQKNNHNVPRENQTSFLQQEQTNKPTNNIREAFATTHTPQPLHQSPLLGLSGPRMVDTPGYRVFVGGISWKADEIQLENFFSTHGQVLECKIIMDKNTGKSKGYGFVTFKDAGAAEFVKQTANFNFLGKNMNVGDAVRKVAEPNGANTTTNSSGARSIPNNYNNSNGYHQPGGGGGYYNQNYYNRGNDTQFYGQYSPDGTYYPAPYYYQQQGFRGSPSYQYGYQNPNWNVDEPTSQESSPGTSPSYQYPYSPPSTNFNPYYTNGNYYNPYYYQQYSSSYPGYGGYNGNFSGEAGEDGSGNHNEHGQHSTSNGDHDSSVYTTSSSAPESAPVNSHSNVHPTSAESSNPASQPTDSNVSITATDPASAREIQLKSQEQAPYPAHQATQPRQIPNKAYNGGGSGSPQHKGAPRASPKSTQRPPQQSQPKPKQKSHRPPPTSAQQDPTLRNVIPSFNKLSVSSN